MKVQKALNPAFCKFEDWQKHLPDEFKTLSLAAWLQKSRRAQWARFSKTLGERSIPMWKKSEIVTWFQVSFGSVFPDHVASLVAALGEPKKPSRKKAHRSSNPSR